MSDARPALGFDVGGQSVKAVLVLPGGEVISRVPAPTGSETDPEALATTIGLLRDALFRDASETRGLKLEPAGATVGVGIAGVIDRSGALRGSPHLPRLLGTRLADLLSTHLATPVVVHNDADCAAMAEGWGGSVDGARDFLLVAIGTGIGSGLVLDGKLRVGDSGFGCEFGHVMVVHNGRTCGCGNKGCLEAYISETAARRYVEEGMPELRNKVTTRRSQRGGGFAEALFDLGALGHHGAESIANQMVDVLGAAIGSAVNVLDLTTIVIGGGIAPGVIARMDRLKQAIAGTLFARQVSDLRIVSAARGPLAGAIGAARLGMLAN